MAAYKNDYSKIEDFILWQLHEIRHKMAKKILVPKVINQTAKDIIEKYHLKNIKTKFSQ